jgi:hypothetical protein
MTLSPPRFRSLSAIVLALVWTSLTFGAAVTPAEAKSRAVFYTAELAAPASEDNAIVGGVVWECTGTTCIAPKTTSSRPKVLCKRVAREFGEITSFTAGDKALEADDLASCNAK